MKTEPEYQGLSRDQQSYRQQYNAYLNYIQNAENIPNLDGLPGPPSRHGPITQTVTTNPETGARTVTRYYENGTTFLNERGYTTHTLDAQGNITVHTVRYDQGPDNRAVNVTNVYRRGPDGNITVTHHEGPPR